MAECVDHVSPWVMLGFEGLHELWASIAQIAIAIYVLASYMSWACVAPVIVPIVRVAVTVPVTQRIGFAQGTWNAAVEKRVNVTSAVLSILKQVRILGIGPFVAFALYAVILRINDDSNFTASKAPTSLSLINLIAAPISEQVQSLPSFTSSLSSLSLIESFVSSTTSSDGRKLQDGKSSLNTRCIYLRGPEADHLIEDQELSELEPSISSYYTSQRTLENSFIVRQAKFGWKADSNVINSCNFEIQDGALTVIMGPVGCGKSTLLYGLLNAVRYNSGQAWLKHRNVSHYEQTPWLVSRSIHHNITCGTALDQHWYDEILDACALVQDLEHLSGRDMHEVGNEGSSLSGGQRQCIEGTVTVTAEPSSVENAIMATGTAEGDVRVSDNKKRQGQAENNISSGPSREIFEAKADLRRPTGGWTICSFYARATGRFNAITFLCLCLSCAFCYQFTTIWIQWWSNATDHTHRRSNGFYLGIYALLCALGPSTLYLAC
ncbi:ABC transporter [Fusarium oxysporum f. sp. phaseoli]